MLARGKPFDEANKLAVKDQWTRDPETLETMPPLSSPEDDVYRLYDIGVANEALADEAPDLSLGPEVPEPGGHRLRESQPKPSEKYFIDPQTRDPNGGRTLQEAQPGCQYQHGRPDVKRQREQHNRISKQSGLR